jgi:Zn-dependent protease
MDFFIFSIIVLIISAVAHEIAHGYAADLLGDPTPRLQGRLTLNPLKHLDPIGSFLLPVLTYNIGGFIFGWAKPVEFNPYNLKHPKRDEMIIAVAGPFTNFIIALAFGLLTRFSTVFGLSESMIAFASIVTVVNLSLMIFNLMPIPPLDGSKILLNLIPERFYRFREWFISNTLIIFILFIFFASRIIGPIIQSAFTLITGYNLVF